MLAAQDAGRPTSATTSDDVSIALDQGHALAATLHQPANPLGIAVLINGATGVPRGYYHAFARHLAGRGISVLTYDYRGIGGSQAVPGCMEDWGRLDQAAALAFVADRCRGHALAIVGHSLGGQILGLAHNIDKVAAACLVAAQSGYWRHWPWPRRARMWFLWWIMMPGLSVLLGRFPGSRFGSADLPAGVALNWARWGRSPHYICDRRGAALRPYNHKVGMPIRWLSFSDDPVAPFAAVEALRDYYPNAAQLRLHLTPADVGTDAVGHFGFFRKSMPGAQWDATVDWLIAAVSGTKAVPHIHPSSLRSPP